MFNKVLDNLEKKSQESISKEEGDYYKDGLLMCGKCNTPKQTKVEFNGKILKPRCLCKCGAEKRDKEQAEFKRQQELERIDRLRRSGFSDSEMDKWTFENDDKANEKISTVARNYVDNFKEMRKKGKGLLFFGNVGTGKTFTAACIANALIDKGYPCLVTNFARLTNTISGMFEGKQNYIDSLNNYVLLVIDDLASERDTEYMNEIVMNIIDARYRSGLPLIVTTNLTANELKDPKEVRKQRIYSRLMEMCVPIEVEGQDRRKEKLKNDYEDVKDILGL